MEPQVPAAQALWYHPRASGGTTLAMVALIVVEVHAPNTPLILAHCHFHGWILPSQLQRSPAPQEPEVCQLQYSTI